MFRRFEYLYSSLSAGCLKTKFNSNYPTRLNGIISQHEFQESIANINSKIFSNKAQIFCIVFFAVVITAGIALIIIGGVASASLSRSSFPFIILLYVGVVLIGFAPLILSIGCCIVRKRRTAKMRHAIAEESKKYSTRATWRLNISRLLTVGYGRRVRTVFVYHVSSHRKKSKALYLIVFLFQLIIDVHHPVGSRGSARLQPSRSPSRPASTIRSQGDTLPPPYPGHSVTHCSQCGAASSGPLAKFCSSCGYQFNTY